jgi:hypothetical protein
MGIIHKATIKGNLGLIKQLDSMGFNLDLKSKTE